MDRRRFVLAASSAAALPTAAVVVSGSALAQAPRLTVPEYVGAMTVMWRSGQWVLDELSRLMDAQEREDEEWRIDVLAAFAVVDTLHETTLALDPPNRYATGYERWLEALDELVAAGLHLRNGVLSESERSYDLATRAIDRATDLMEEAAILLPNRVRRYI